MIGIMVFFLMATTVYALNTNDRNNDFVNESTMPNQNCPYYDETTRNHNCPNNENGYRWYNHGHNGSSHGRHGSCPRCNR